MSEKKNSFDSAFRGILLLAVWTALLAFLLQAAVNNLCAFAKLSGYYMGYDTAFYVLALLVALRLTWKMLGSITGKAGVDGNEIAQAFVQGLLVSRAMNPETGKSDGAKLS